MKKTKNFFVLAVITAVTFASCSKSEFEDLNNLDPNAIKFASTTTRASINNLGSLEAATAGFTVYARSANQTDDWYSNVDGNNNYKYDAGAWKWATTNALWPTTTAGYPMNFYAYYPATGQGGLAVTATPSTGTIFGVVSIPFSVSDQRDIIAAKQIGVSAKPFDGTLPLTFQHILSKVNMGIIAGDGVTAYVQHAAVEQVCSSNMYDFLQGTWVATPSNEQSYNYYASAALPKPVHTAAGTATEDVAVPFYTGNHANHLMQLPQTTTAWAPANNVLPATGESYIGMIYRLESTQDNIGYADARDYLTDNPGYADVNSWTSANGTTYTGIGGATPYGNKPLFVKVGYPLSSTWVMGKSYTYNILLGTAGASNGYLLSGNYVDENGSDTGIPVGKNPGEPIVDGIIHFNVAVSDWDDQTATQIK